MPGTANHTATTNASINNHSLLGQSQMSIYYTRNNAKLVDSLANQSRLMQRNKKSHRDEMSNVASGNVEQVMATSTSPIKVVAQNEKSDALETSV